MMKRLSLAAALSCILVSTAYCAGTIPYSLSQQLDEFGKPLANCFLYIIQAGTVSTPQNAFQDSALTLPLPNPLRCDASGRLPQFFISDGSIKVRLTKSNGVNVVTADGILVVGASSGGGGGSPVDATTVLATGDIKPRYGTGVLSGFVRLNGRTIGSASSGASERANADTQALFEYLWGADSNLAISSGRGATANADWVANKTLTLPDMRGRAMAGLSDMGNSDSGLYSGVTFTTGGPTTIGSLVGASRRTLTVLEIPSHTHANTLSDPGHVHPISDPGHVHTLNNASNLIDGGAGSSFGGGGVGSAKNVTANGAFTGISVLGAFTNLTINNAAQGGGQAFDSISPYALITIYIKL